MFRSLWKELRLLFFAIFFAIFSTSTEQISPDSAGPFIVSILLALLFSLFLSFYRAQSLALAPHPLALLRTRGERPCCRAAKESDELAPSHVPRPPAIGSHPTHIVR